jgi:hypothetical protein
MVYTKACPSLELQTLPKFRPVSLSLSMFALIIFSGIFSEYRRRETLKPNEMANRRSTLYRPDPNNDIPEENEDNKENKNGNLDPYCRVRLV